MLSELMARGRPRPRFGAEVAAELRDQLERSLAPVIAEPLSVNKRDLNQVHACEAHHQAQADEPFAWNVRNGIGTVVHRAVELSVGAPADRHPLDLVDQAIESLSGNDPRNVMGDYLRAAPESVLSELRASANEAVVKFQECWPPLQRAWRPRAEMRIRAQLCGGQLELHGKVDLALGLPRGDEARELFVDLKTGRSYPNHLDDLRFYALIQCLRAGVPPFRVASYYFDTASFHHEDVTPESLEIAVGRTIDGVRKLCELRRGDRPPAITPGPTCSYCRLNDTCDGARQWEDQRSGE